MFLHRGRLREKAPCKGIVKKSFVPDSRFALRPAIGESVASARQGDHHLQQVMSPTPGSDAAGAVHLHPPSLVSRGAGMDANYDNRDEHRSCRSTAAESSASAFALGGRALQGYAEVGRCKDEKFSYFMFLYFFRVHVLTRKPWSTSKHKLGSPWRPTFTSGALVAAICHGFDKVDFFLDAAFFAGLPADRIFQAPLESIQQLQSVFRRCFVARHEPRRKKATLVAACVFRSDDEFLGRCLSGWVERACI